MPTSCVACKSRYTNGSNVTFHKFPANDTALFKKWLEFVGRSTWRPTGFSKICSLHFEQKCFKYNNGRRYLVPGSAPTIHDVPQHLQKMKRCTGARGKETDRSRKEPCPSDSNGGSDVFMDWDNSGDVDDFLADGDNSGTKVDDHSNKGTRALLASPNDVSTTSSPIVLRLSVVPNSQPNTLSEGNSEEAQLRPSNTDAQPTVSSAAITPDQLKQALIVERIKTAELRAKLRSAREILENQQKRIMCLEEVINSLRYRLIRASAKHEATETDSED